MAYSNVPIGTSNPSCFVILVDQSWSMSEEWQSQTTKAEAATRAVNRLIEELVLKCQSGDTIKDRCHVSVIGYGESIECILDNMISEVASALIEVKKVNKLIPDGAGGVIEVEAEMPIWLEPRADNGTPMAEAFERAGQIVQRWCREWPDGFPPSVVNITDGAARFPDIAATEARKIMNLGTTDGNALVYNLHIANSRQGIVLPNNTSQFAGDSYAEYLFSISSEMPNSLLEEAKAQDIPAEPNARCFTYNVDQAWMIKLLHFGTLGTLNVLGSGQPQPTLPA
jgi:hypothetical protein